MKRAEPSLKNLNAVLAAAGVAVLLALAYGAHVFSEKTESLAKAVARLAVAEVRISGVYTQVLEAESSQRGYLLVNDPNYLDPFRAARARGEENLAIAVQKLGQLNVDARGLDALREIVSKKYDELDKTVALAQAGQREAAIDIVRANHGRELMSRIRELTIAELDRLATMRKQWIVELQDSADTMTVLNVLGSVAVFLLAGLAVAQQVRHSSALAVAQQNLAAANDALKSRVAARTRDLRRANEEIQRYAYIVSHDLRAPLVNIIGFARELENAFASLKPLAETARGRTRRRKGHRRREGRHTRGAEIHPLLHQPHGCADRGHSKTVAARGAHVATPDRRPRSVGARLYRHRAAPPQRRWRARSKSRAACPAWSAIATRFRRCSPTCSTMRPNISRTRGSDASCCAADKRPTQTSIEVEDNGRGVAAKDQSRIFELFRRAGTQDQPGDGIGLAHVRTLARRMGGDVTVRSDGRSGSVFTVTLPSDLRAFLNHEPREDRNV